jgi:hypothetical protein
VSFLRDSRGLTFLYACFHSKTVERILISCDVLEAIETGVFQNCFPNTAARLLEVLSPNVCLSVCTQLANPGRCY